jgi:hypothetical protein
LSNQAEAGKAQAATSLLQDGLKAGTQLLAARDSAQGWHGLPLRLPSKDIVYHCLKQHVEAFEILE